MMYNWVTNPLKRDKDKWRCRIGLHKFNLIHREHLDDDVLFCEDCGLIIFS